MAAMADAVTLQWLVVTSSCRFLPHGARFYCFVIRLFSIVVSSSVN